MKNLTKLSVAALLSAALFMGNTVKAQTMSSTAMSPNPWRLGIGIEPGIITGNYFKTSTLGLDASLRLQYNTGSVLSLMVTSGFVNFFPNNSTGPTTKIGNVTYNTQNHSQGIIPVKAGFKAFFYQSFYVSGEAGVGFETQYNEDKKLILSPGIGYAHHNWDASAVYENFSGQSNQYGLAGIRVAYGFGL